MNPVAAAECEIVSTRVFHTPRERVFGAWTDPALIAKWWGPKGFTNTFHEFDPRPGGTWRFVMHAPNGTNYPNHSEFIEITRPERIVIDHISAPKFRVVVTFTENSGATTVTFRQIFGTAEECNRIKGIAVPANEENFDRLEAVLAEGAPRA